ncbi:MAG: transcription termination/antitermination protein NusA [Bacilli bacterium]|nr:transcription termination/antitermination protein NusA [Bacilli bacterium]
MKKMNSKEFTKALELLEERGMEREYIYEAMVLALTSAYKKNTGLSNVRVEVDKDKNEFKLFSFKTVVLDETHKESLDEDNIPMADEEILSEEDLENEELEDLPEEFRYRPFVFNEKIHITLEDARKLDPEINIGETIEEEVVAKEFGRVAAATAKQVIIQKVREAERNNIANEFGEKQDEMMSGLVEMEDENNYYINLGRTQGLLPKSEIIPGEEIKMGSNIKVYISKVDINSKGALILLSRKHYGFIKRLFELEIPEISDGTVLIYSVAREAGNRTKIAVYSEVNNVDPIGACIGERGTRIANILKELGKEKIDIVKYSKDPVEFIQNALSPAKDLRVFVLDEKTKETMVVVNDENLSLAIGKKGINVKLASRLTHYNLEIKTLDQVKEAGINILE